MARGEEENRGGSKENKFVKLFQNKPRIWKLISENNKHYNFLFGKTEKETSKKRQSHQNFNSNLIEKFHRQLWWLKCHIIIDTNILPTPLNKLNQTSIIGG